MGKILIDSPVLPSPPPEEAPGSATSPAVTVAWNDVAGLDPQQRRQLQNIHTRGVYWEDPRNPSGVGLTFRLSHGGAVDSDGNCLFSAVRIAMGPEIGLLELRQRTVQLLELRQRTVQRFLHDLASADGQAREKLESKIQDLYAPVVTTGCGLQFLQEVKLLARKSDRKKINEEIQELMYFGQPRDLATERIYWERCIVVNDGASWAKYMSITGTADDEFDIISLQFAEDGLFMMDDNWDGHLAAFADEITIESLATELKREIYVVQAHGSYSIIDEKDSVYFLVYRPRSEVVYPPVFLFVKTKVPVWSEDSFIQWISKLDLECLE